MVRIREATYLGVVLIGLLFLQINFDLYLGVIFMGMVLSLGKLYDLDKNWTLVIERKPNKLFSLLLGIGGAISVVVIGSLTIPLVLKTTELVGLSSVIGLMAQYQPIFEGNLYLTLIGWGIAIPIIETPFFFGRVWEFITDRIKVRLPGIQQLKINDVRSWLVAVIISFIFMAFHLTAKVGPAGSGVNEALYMVWLFGMVSMALIFIEKQLLSAMIMHILLNSIYIIQNFSIEILSPILIVPIIGVGIAIAIFSREKVKIGSITI